MSHSLERFGFGDMMTCRAAFRTMFEDQPAALEDAAERVVRFLFEELVDDEGKPACALVRFFRTQAYEGLPDSLKERARAADPGALIRHDARCLILLATAGVEPAWNDRQLSEGHQAIPLASEEFVTQAPMIAQLLHQFAVDLSRLLRPGSSLFASETEASLNVFYVPDAKTSPHIPSRESFVIPYGVRSVVGFGGMFGAKDFFAVILFSRVGISADTADAFKILGLNLKVALLPIARRPLFH